MAERQVIASRRPANRGVDYAALQEEGIALVQQLAGDIWTDYNEHDPGVTTLEQLCYALTELSYRAELPLADLLTEKRTGKIDPRRQGLYVPLQIFPCNPLTEDDYRKLIVDRVPEVANVWLQPRQPSVPGESVDGLYDVLLYLLPFDRCAIDPRSIPERVRRVYARHRNLCEDVHAIQVLRPLPAVLFADVTIDDGAAPESILAGVLLNVGLLLAPEPRRRPLKALLAEGRTPAEIFTGPLLDNGFIADDQLGPKPTSIPMQEVVAAVAASPGVLAVADVGVRVGDGGGPCRDNDSIPVGPGRILELDTRRAVPPDATVRLWRDGIECEVDPERVERELDELWAEHRRVYRLAVQYRELFAFPRGEYRDVRRYDSIQNQYPDVYGISSYGLPPDPTPERRGQAKQLKGYLLVFEQLLANYFAQLAYVKDLYSIDPGLRYTYAYQYLTSVPDVGPLLEGDPDDGVGAPAGDVAGSLGYWRGLPALVHGQDPAVRRRNRFLSFLLALYAERLDASSVAAWTWRGEERDDVGLRLLRANNALARWLVESTHDRGRGFDYLDGPSARNVAGMVIKSRIQLGLPAEGHRPLLGVLEEQALELADGGTPEDEGGALDGDYIAEHFTPVGRAAGDDDREERRGDVPPALLRGWSVSEEFLRAAGEIDNFRIGSLSDSRGVDVVCRPPTGGRWRHVGRYSNRAAAIAEVRALTALVRYVSRHCQQLYVVEHTLLRFGRRPGSAAPAGAAEPGAATSGGRGRGDAGPFVYSFTVTAVLSVGPHHHRQRDYARFAREVLRQNAPAHVVVDTCFLRCGEMRHFESLYFAWRHALRSGDRPAIASRSGRLRHFLQRHTHRVPWSRESTAAPPDHGPSPSSG